MDVDPVKVMKVMFCVFYYHEEGKWLLPLSLPHLLLPDVVFYSYEFECACVYTTSIPNI